jgi:hypothetical protein
MAFLPFYKRIAPAFSPQNTDSLRLFGNIPNFNATDIYELTFFPESVVTQMIQNFYNFLNPTMFWLMFIPFYERLGPIFSTNSGEERPNSGTLMAAEFNISRKITEIDVNQNFNLWTENQDPSDSFTEEETTMFNNDTSRTDNNQNFQTFPYLNANQRGVMAKYRVVAQ